MGEQGKVILERKRIDYVDVFRGVGIVLMIMGHIGFGTIFDYWIHAFHMPMFFFVSGYFYQNRDISVIEFIKKKCRSLLIPYFTFAIFHYCMWLCFNHSGIHLEPLQRIFFVNTTGDGIPIAGALWFLTALFWSDVIYFILNKMIKNQMKLSITVLIIAIAGNCLPNILAFRLPWAMDVAFVGIGIYHIACLLHKLEDNVHIHKVFHMNWFTIFCVALIDTVLIFQNRYVNMRTGQYGFIPLFWLNAILLIIVGWNITRKLSELSGKNRMLQIVINGLKDIGKNSIVYLCLNQFIIKVCEIVIDKVCPVEILKAFFIFVFVMSLLWILENIIVKTKLKIFIGK